MNFSALPLVKLATSDSCYQLLQNKGLFLPWCCNILQLRFLLGLMFNAEMSLVRGTI